MFFTCCKGRSGKSKKFNNTEITHKSNGIEVKTIHQTLNQSTEKVVTTQEQEMTKTSVPIKRERPVSVSSFTSFYSVKSNDDGDFYSLCDEDSVKSIRTSL
ncbi:hypothetical protein ABEB36_003565 [Hypothenemus hampei]|uniref:Uncharacterized protein n=1 Tax=Hypothenemus hampei TaxID=57062 RepID=A0ABD1F9L3_HYPHA